MGLEEWKPNFRLSRIYSNLFKCAISEVHVYCPGGCKVRILINSYVQTSANAHNPQAAGWLSLAGRLWGWVNYESVGLHRKLRHTWKCLLGYGNKNCCYKPGNKEHRSVRECSMQNRSFCKHNQAGLKRQWAVTLKAKELVQWIRERTARLEV